MLYGIMNFSTLNTFIIPEGCISITNMIESCCFLN